MCDVADLVPAFKHLTGETGNICRLCFDAVETGISLDESHRVECFYYDDNVTYADMLNDLEAPSDPTLPQLLCKYCADLTIKGFFFQKLSQYSNNKWQEAIELLNQTVKSADSIVDGVKRAYILIQKDNVRVVTGRKEYEEVTKEAVVETLKKTIDRRYNFENNCKEKTVVCHKCGKKIKHRYVAAHMKRRHDTNQYPCPKCNKIFKTPILLRSHVERVHAPKNIQCPKCNKMFGSQRTLRCHTTQYHIEASCKRCFEQFPSRVALNSHLETHNTHQCPRCSKKFRCRLALTRHSKRCCENPDTVICDICNKHFSTKRNLSGHMATIHGFGGIHTCMWCKKSFDAASKLKVHIIKHTRERSFSCELCGCVFVSKAALTYHKRIHTGEKPFACKECGQRFLSTSRRMSHIRLKHQGPRLECSVCGSMFHTKFELSKHSARHKNPKSKLFVPEFILISEIIQVSKL